MNGQLFTQDFLVSGIAQSPVWKSLSDASLDVLITGESPFDDLPAVMADLARAPGDTLCHRIRY